MIHCLARPATCLRHEVTVRGFLQGMNELRSTQRATCVGALTNRGDLGFGFAVGEILPPVPHGPTTIPRVQIEKGIPAAEPQ
jgi:hypothetical protein